MNDFQLCKQDCGISELCLRSRPTQDITETYFEFPFQWRTPFSFWCPGLLLKEGVWSAVDELLRDDEETSE